MTWMTHAARPRILPLPQSQPTSPMQLAAKAPARDSIHQELAGLFSQAQHCLESVGWDSFLRVRARTSNPVPSGKGFLPVGIDRPNTISHSVSQRETVCEAHCM